MNQNNFPANFWSIDHDSKSEVQRRVLQWGPPPKKVAQSKPKAPSAHRKSFGNGTKVQQSKTKKGRVSVKLKQPKPRTPCMPVKKQVKPKKLVIFLWLCFVLNVRSIVFDIFHVFMIPVYSSKVCSDHVY